MKLTVTGKHLTLTDADHAEIVRKIGRLDRLLNDSAVSAACVVGRERQQFVCELTTHARGKHVLHGVGRGKTVAAAANIAVSKVLQQAQRLVDRWKTRRHGAGGRTIPGGAPGGPAGGTPPPVAARVIRSRSYAVKPLTVDDAALLLVSDGDRAFLVFRNASTDSVAVIYRRPDGHLGLIEPDA